MDQYYYYFCTQCVHIYTEIINLKKVLVTMKKKIKKFEGGST